MSILVNIKGVFHNNVMLLLNELSILSANCQGLRDMNKCTDVLNYLQNLNSSIICLQDTHWIEKDLKLLNKLWQGHILINKHRSNARGVAKMLKNNFEYKILDSYCDDTNNIIFIDLKLDNMTLKIINIYGPNIDSPWFYDNLNDILINNELDYTIISEDFNLVLNPEMDCHNYKTINNPHARARLIDIISEQNLVDTFRLLHLSTRRYTWRRKTPIKQARLDYFLCSDNLCDHIKSSNIKPG